MAARAGGGAGLRPQHDGAVLARQLFGVPEVAVAGEDEIHAGVEQRLLELVRAAQVVAEVSFPHRAGAVVHHQDPRGALVGSPEAIARPFDLATRQVAEVHGPAAGAGQADEMRARDRHLAIEVGVDVPPVGAKRADQAADQVGAIDVVVARHRDDRGVEPREEGGDPAPGGRLLCPLDQVTGGDHRVGSDALGGLEDRVGHPLGEPATEVQIGDVQESRAAHHAIDRTVAGRRVPD